LAQLDVEDAAEAAERKEEEEERLRCDLQSYRGAAFISINVYLRGSEQPPAPPFGTFRNTVPARTVRNVPGEHPT
jgi:hypothetical protein